MEKPNRPIKLNIIIDPDEYAILKGIKTELGATMTWQLKKAKDKYLKHAKEELIKKHGYETDEEGLVFKPEAKAKINPNK